MTIKTINIGNKEKAIESFKRMRDKNYGKVDIKIENLHLRKLNKMVGETIFIKNDAYVTSETLWELMQSFGKKSHHHYHNLTPECIFEALHYLKEPYCIIKTGSDRYPVLSKYETNGKRMITIIEINARSGFDLIKINKIITIYPKDRINQYISGKTILYLNCKI